MFMRYGQGFPLSPLKGEWFIHGQPNDWKDTDDYIHGIYNHNISVSANIPADVQLSLLIKAGNDILYHANRGGDHGFQSYPAVWLDDAGSRPSGIDTNLVGLEFMETTLIIREKEYYDQRPPVTITVKFEQGPNVYTRTYKLSLTWDNYFSNIPNDLICDLSQFGLPFIPKYKDWLGWQPITGEYIYTCTTPVAARVDFTGYWVGCFAENLQAQLDFNAFRPAQHKGGPYMRTSHSLTASLDLCMAGLEAFARNSGFPNGNFSAIRAAGQQYYLLQSAKGTFVFEEPHPKGMRVYLTEQPITVAEFVPLIGNKELWMYHEFRKDPLGHQRAQVGRYTFWQVLSIDNPAPAFGGVSGENVPISFVYGIMEFTARFPLWWMRFGAFPVLA